MIVLKRSVQRRMRTLKASNEDLDRNLTSFVPRSPNMRRNGMCGVDAIAHPKTNCWSPTEQWRLGMLGMLSTQKVRSVR